MYTKQEKEADKIGRLMMRKVVTSKKASLVIDNENKTHFRFWVFDCDLQDAAFFHIPLIGTKHDLFSFSILANKFEGWKWRHFCGWPRATLTLVTPLIKWCRFGEKMSKIRKLTLECYIIDKSVETFCILLHDFWWMVSTECKCTNDHLKLYMLA